MSALPAVNTGRIYGQGISFPPRVGPDGAIYLATDNSAGRILKVVPAR